MKTIRFVQILLLLASSICGDPTGRDSTCGYSTGGIPTGRYSHWQRFSHFACRFAWRFLPIDCPQVCTQNAQNGDFLQTCRGGFSKTDFVGACMALSPDEHQTGLHVERTGRRFLANLPTGSHAERYDEVFLQNRRLEDNI